MTILGLNPCLLGQGIHLNQNISYKINLYHNRGSLTSKGHSEDQILATNGSRQAETGDFLPIYPLILMIKNLKM